MAEEKNALSLVDHFLQELEKLAELCAAYKISPVPTILTMAPDPEIGSAPDYLVPHCITHYAIFLTKERMAQKRGDVEFRTKPEDIAMKYLDGSTPSQRSCDITRLPGWIECVAAACEEEAPAFQHLLDAMLQVTLDLLETRNKIREALGLEPIEISCRPHQNRSDPAHPNLAT